MIKDKNITVSVTKKLQDLGYDVSLWDTSLSPKLLNEDILEVLKTSSKRNHNLQKTKENYGYPDRIFFNKEYKLLILVEEKSNIKKHRDNNPLCENFTLSNECNVVDFAIQGIIWYMQQFVNKLKNLEDYKIIGIAVSGDISENKIGKFDCFVVNNARIKHVKEITNFVKIEEFLSIFIDFDEQKHIENIKQSSKKINQLLRDLDSTERPVILSYLMIALYGQDLNKKFELFSKIKDNKNLLIDMISSSIQTTLTEQKVMKNKIDFIKSKINLLKESPDVKIETIHSILTELKENVLPLINGTFSTRSNFDIIGKFYEEFLKYAGFANVKRGIVLTPEHITTLFTNLIDIKTNDVILDICCGTGSFLIAAMNKIINTVENQNLLDKKEKIDNIKKKQIIGVEINTTMYILAISNMLFRGDGKSQIFHGSAIGDSFETKEIIKKIKELSPTIGFINPPYSGRESKTNPTFKEITFLEKILSLCSRYVIIIAPYSMYFSENERRAKILKQHKLKAVINMPKELFQPNAATYTSIAIFETNIPHNFDEEVAFYDLKDDGFVMTPKGRVDFNNNWAEKEKKLLDFIKNPNNKGNLVNSIKTKIKENEEWNIYAHTKTDYSNLKISNFEKVIKNYILFQIKKDFDILHLNLDEYELLEQLIFSKKFSEYQRIIKKQENYTAKLNINKWKWFKITDIFKIENSKVQNTKELITGQEIYYIGAAKNNNGVKAKVEKIDSYVSKGNCVLFINGGEGSGGYSLYQPDDFMAIKGFTSCGYSKKLNVFNGLFLVTVLDQHRYKFSYGRSWQANRFNSTKICLPINEKGKIDWNFMTNFVKNHPLAKLIEE